MTMHFDARDFARNVSPVAHFAAQSSLVLRDERMSDVAAREALLDASFGAGRFGKTCERLREGRIPSRGLAFSAVDQGVLVGTLRLWDIQIGSGRGVTRALMLGPLAVAMSHQSVGLGGAMIRKALSRAKELRHGAVILVGDAPYYNRFGFERHLATSLELPGPVEDARFLAFELVEGALSQARGRVVPTGRLAHGMELREAA